MKKRVSCERVSVDPSEDVKVWNRSGWWQVGGSLEAARREIAEERERLRGAWDDMVSTSTLLRSSTLIPGALLCTYTVSVHIVLRSTR